MSKLPEDLKYHETHIWARRESDDRIQVGITDFAQQQLGDVVYVELPELGKTVSAGAAITSIESVKAASDIFAPVSGEIVETNASLAEQPEAVNADPYGAWIFRIRMSDATEWNGMLDAEQYGKLLEE
jgi:glycine cleavage system H protein